MQGLDSGAVVKLARRSEWEVINVIEINFFFSVTFGKFVLSVTDTSQFTLQKAITIAEEKGIQVLANNYLTIKSGEINVT